MNYNKLISLGSIVALMGFIMSGPVAFVLVNLISPQPPWVSSRVFVENYSTIQDLPYYFGFLLMGGMLMLSAGNYLRCRSENSAGKFQALLSLSFTIIFSALISFNYICQTTFVRNLVLNYQPEFDVAISTFSMVNPLSFCWANEMWGYAFLGIATWLMASYYHNRSELLRTLLRINGIVSIGSALFTIIDVSWVMTTAGFVLYFAWNVLMIVMMLVIIRFTRALPKLI